LLEFSFRHWKQHSPYLKLPRGSRLPAGAAPSADAAWSESTACDGLLKTDADTPPGRRGPGPGSGTTKHDRDHAFALRTLADTRRASPRREGLVPVACVPAQEAQHWDSNAQHRRGPLRAGAYISRRASLGVREDATVKVGSETRSIRVRARRLHGQGQASRAGRTAPWTPNGLGRRSGEDHARHALRVRDLALRTDVLPKDEGGRPLRGVAHRISAAENRAGTWTSCPSAEGGAWAWATRSRSSSRCGAKRRPNTCTCATRAAPASSRSRCSGFKWKTGLGLYERCGTAGRTSSSMASRRASTRSATGSAPPPRALSAWPGGGAVDVRTGFAARSAGTVLEVAGSVATP